MESESPQDAAQAVTQAKGDVQVEPNAEAAGTREWLSSAPPLPNRAVSCDTRVRLPLGLGSSAARATARRLRSAGVERVGAPVGFYVDKNDHLLAGERQRALAWGHELTSEVGVS